MQVWYRHKSRFGSNAGYRRLLDVRSAKNIYRRRSCVYDTVGHAPLAIDRLLDVRTTKWQKQLPTTMQCRSHSRRLTIECLFVTACSMDEYAEEKRTKKNLIVRSGISEAETTNNKRLRSTFCIEAIQTRSIARPLCDSKASCYTTVPVFRSIKLSKIQWKLPAEITPLRRKFNFFPIHLTMYYQ